MTQWTKPVSPDVDVSEASEGVSKATRLLPPNYLSGTVEQFAESFSGKCKPAPVQPPGTIRAFTTEELYTKDYADARKAVEARYPGIEWHSAGACMDVAGFYAYVTREQAKTIPHNLLRQYFLED